MKTRNVIAMGLTAMTLTLGMMDEPKKDKPKIIIKAGPVVIVQPTQK